jgi:hypothetical protein
MKFSENQKIKDLVKTAKRDPDAATVFYFDDISSSDCVVVVVKPKATADIVIKWLRNQGLTTDNPVPKEKEKQ